MNPNAKCSSPTLYGGETWCAKRSPWNAVLEEVSREPDTIEVFCGGTIISSKHILTAAHCVWSNIDGCSKDWINLNASRDCNVNNCRIDGCHRIENDYLTVALGVTSVKQNVEKHSVSKIFIHPGWNKTAYFDTRGNDLAILELKNPITEWTDSVQPACLPDPVQLTDYMETNTRETNSAPLVNHQVFVGVIQDPAL